MANMESKNTVRVEQQNMNWVTFEGDPQGSPRIMIVGNSVTRHQPLAEIGWHNDWGMAASAKERDYAHLIFSHVLEKHPNAAFCIVQAAVWERTYESPNYDEHFAAALGFHPDVIITAISANISADRFDHDTFIRQMGGLHRYLSDGATPRIIQGTSFFDNEGKSSAIRDYIATVGGDAVELSDLCHAEENLAIGKFEHEGIQHHPGDLGMRRIADRFIAVLDEYI